MKPHTRIAAVLAALVLACAGTAAAQSWPAKPIRMIVTFPPGGSTDLVARAIAPKMAEKLGQQVLVENRPGAGGNIGMDLVAKAAPDGYTVGIGAAGALAVNVSLYPAMPFAPEKDLAPVSMVAMIPFVLVGGPTLAAKDLRETIALARAQPGKLSMGHGGNGTAMHLSGELLKMLAKLDIAAIPYKGSGPAAADTLGGQLQMAVVDVPSSLANIRAGKLKALAVTTPRRITALPDVPTFAESGVAGYDSTGWFGLVTTAGVSGEIIARLNAALVETLAAPEVRERVIAAGAEPLTGSPQEFAAMIRSETQKWAQVVKVSGAKAQ
ncbi:MAG: tripartite tricarboxylate transporter substrate binding protein [Betaproteobacteria bacterium]|nr:tripartite tricarboxylate transporter substrate binding protein [Betaproteobacteria bacterium]